MEVVHNLIDTDVCSVERRLFPFMKPMRRLNETYHITALSGSVARHFFSWCVALHCAGYWGARMQGAV